MIDIRKLAAVDMALHGARAIIAEFALGVAIPLILGLISIRAVVLGLVQSGWATVFGFWLIGIAANYVPLLIYAVVIVRSGTVKEEGQPELAHAKRYGIQQVILLVPFLVAILALWQEIRQ